MIGPLHLGQVQTHIGMSFLCLCCCDDKVETGGKSFDNSQNPFTQFIPPNQINSDNQLTFSENTDTLGSEVVEPLAELHMDEVEMISTDSVLPNTFALDHISRMVRAEFQYFLFHEEQEFLILITAADDEDCNPCD